MSKLDYNSAQDFDTLITEWRGHCACMSFWHMMNKAPQYEELLKFDKDLAISRILFLLSKGEKWIGFSTLLGVISQDRPKYEPERMGGFAGFKVGELAQSWLAWAKEKNIEIPKE